jgi:hypothetical protein
VVHVSVTDEHMLGRELALVQVAAVKEEVSLLTHSFYVYSGAYSRFGPAVSE